MWAVTRTSDADFLVLHALRLKGFADAAALTALTGLDDAEVNKRLDVHQHDGLVTRREGRISGWALTPAGRSRHKELIVAEVSSSGARDDIEAAYQRFLAVNNDLLAICTDWQLRDGALNDHTDAGYDRAVVARLRGIDDVVQPVCSDRAGAMQRFASYGPRLSRALDRVEGGDGDWFAKPVIDSYHTVWFELHEDLLVTLGLERSKEGAR